MGKGFNNYMCKKFFHPASRDNLKRVWMAQQKDDAYRKKQEELRMQYEKEQDLYNNKALLSKESKDKLSVNFLYEPPPGAKKEREKEDNEPEYKFEWQRKYNAPREDYCKGDSEIQDQPFGILVRNVRCIKCRKWGHINTDKECPLYNQATVSQIAMEKSDAISLLRQMKEDGLKLKKSALEAQEHLEIPHISTGNETANSEEQSDQIEKSEVKFLMELSTKKKLKLLKRLEKLEKKEKKQKKPKKRKHRKESDNEESDTDSSSEEERKKLKDFIKKKTSKTYSDKKDSKKYKVKNESSDDEWDDGRKTKHREKRQMNKSSEEENRTKSKKVKSEKRKYDSSDSENDYMKKYKK